MNATSISNNIRLGLLSAAISFLAGIGAPASSVHASPSTGTVDLLATPPELTTTVDPNVVVTFDDSGSMMATSLPDALSGRYGNQYYYTALNNFIYFDPTKTYVPPIRADGTVSECNLYQCMERWDLRERTRKLLLWSSQQDQFVYQVLPWVREDHQYWRFAKCNGWQ